MFEARKLFRAKEGNSFCRQMFFQVELTLFSIVLADIGGFVFGFGFVDVSGLWIGEEV